MNSESCPDPRVLGSSRGKTSTTRAPHVPSMKVCAPRAAPLTRCDVQEWRRVISPPLGEGASFCADMLRLFTEPSCPSLLSSACQHLQGRLGAGLSIPALLPDHPAHCQRCSCDWTLSTTVPLFHTNSLSAAPIIPEDIPGQQHIFHAAFFPRPVYCCFSLCTSQSRSAQQIPQEWLFLANLGTKPLPCRYRSRSKEAKVAAPAAWRCSGLSCLAPAAVSKPCALCLLALTYIPVMAWVNAHSWSMPGTWQHKPSL